MQIHASKNVLHDLICAKITVAITFVKSVLYVQAFMPKDCSPEIKLKLYAMLLYSIMF